MLSRAYLKVGHLVSCPKPKLIIHKRKLATRMVDQLKIRLDEFAFRQFDDPTYLGTQIPANKDAFMKTLLEVLKTDKSLSLVDGYAPFCKHIFVKNWIPGVFVGAAKITPENVHLLESGYKARTEKELPVLARWFPKDKITAPESTVLDLILYSKEQVIKECEAMGNPVPSEDFDWALISIKGQTEDFELPMTPMTMMRNSLGREEGGSGVPLDREAYKAAVAFWESHASIM